MASFDCKTISHIHHRLHSLLPSEPALRTKALESLLAEKQLIDPAAVDAWIEMYRDEIGPKRGAVVVARAWIDPAFERASSPTRRRHRRVRLRRARDRPSAGGRHASA